MNRRQFMIAVGLVPLAVPPAFAAGPMLVFRDPSCGCCGAWVDHIRAAGFPVEVRMEQQMHRIKAQLGIPRELASCHSATIGGYVIEGHVPAEVIVKLLRERPSLAGIAVPGMPVGSPGMEVPGQKPEPFRVIGFAENAPRDVYMDYPQGFGG